jgi:hypothetical protein
MKSAYEKALERMEQEKGPAPTLTDEQRKQIAEIASLYESKVAETKFAYEAKIAKATTQQEYDALNAEMSAEIVRLNARMEEEKETVWRQSGEA